MSSEAISSEAFRELISRRAQRLFCAVVYLLNHKDDRKLLNRPLLGDLLSQSTQVEELLDFYGARNNQEWNCFRSLVAAIKLFSNVSYEILHLEYALYNYRLLPLEKDDFAKATEQTLGFTTEILIIATQRILQQARDRQLRIPELAPCVEMYKESLPTGQLERNLAKRSAETVSKTVTLLATAFLNLAATSKPSLPSERIRPKEYKEYKEYLFGPVTEEKLRSIEFQFHNLQSLYDTFVSKTETEGMDKDLPILRGHISVVLHLLRTGTDLAHYFERHIGNLTQIESECCNGLLEPEKLLDWLMNYSVYFAGQYMASAEVLCREMLKRYIEVVQIEVPVPQYRGFHVRPSTLVAKLVLHYGSEVQMEMEGERYDASSPLELFRANEKINAQKRRRLAEKIVQLRLVPDQLGDDDSIAITRHVVMTLSEQGKIIIYEQPLALNDMTARKDVKLIGQVTDEIARLLAMGKIDIRTDLKIRFIGDKRVLEDIKLLAESGYGEDNVGNNIPLTEGLSYLRKS